MMNNMGQGYDGSGEWGTAVADWFIDKVWPYVWRLGLWAIGWLVAGILIKFGFAIADYIMGGV